MRFVRENLYLPFGHLNGALQRPDDQISQFSSAPTEYIFTDTIYLFTTDRWDLYAVVQSTIHEVWARKYSGALKQDLRYSPSKCFRPSPFPMAFGRRKILYSRLGREIPTNIASP